jgi:hypothetical protein
MYEGRTLEYELEENRCMKEEKDMLFQNVTRKKK